jgi:putative endonuclease
MSYVYILESLTDGRYYVGSTIDLENRLKHHLGGYTPSTKRLGKIKLVFSQKYNTIKEAMIIERKLKKLKRKDYLQKIIEDGHIKIKSQKKL